MIDAISDQKFQQNNPTEKDEMKKKDRFEREKKRFLEEEERKNYNKFFQIKKI